MGMVYRPKYKAKDGTTRESAVWWIKYYRDGIPHRESTETQKKNDAERILKDREGRAVRGEVIVPRANRILFKELTTDVVNDYKANGLASLKDLQRRLKLHILPVFGERRAASITTADLRAYVAARQAETIRDTDKTTANATINRELSAIGRTFALATQAGKLTTKPHIPTLQENNVRTGFFEDDQFRAVVGKLVDYLKPVARFAHETGWRVRSEVLNLQWRQIDFKAGWVRLEVGTTKNREGRVFPFTAELRAILEEQRAATEAVQRDRGVIVPWVFHRNGRRIQTYYKAWQSACTAAGCPARLMHDFRRTAARNFTRNGIVEAVAMRLTGHKTRSVFDRYNIVSEGDLLSAAGKLDDAAGKVAGKVDDSKRSVASRKRSK